LLRLGVVAAVAAEEAELPGAAPEDDERDDDAADEGQLALAARRRPLGRLLGRRRLRLFRHRSSRRTTPTRGPSAREGATAMPANAAAAAGAGGRRASGVCPAPRAAGAPVTALLTRGRAGNPCRPAPRGYRITLMRSPSSESLAVMTRAFAWKARCVLIRSMN